MRTKPPGFVRYQNLLPKEYQSKLSKEACRLYAVISNKMSRLSATEVLFVDLAVAKDSEFRSRNLHTVQDELVSAGLLHISPKIRPKEFKWPRASIYVLPATNDMEAEVGSR